MTKNKEKQLKSIVSGVKDVLREPILKVLLTNSLLTETQLETLLVDLVIEDSYGDHISYKEKASLRSRIGTRSKGVSRGAFNRTLKQARQNLMKCLYTILLLAYLGFFDFTVFRPFEEIAAKIGNYREIRDVLAGKADLTSEEIESYRAAERTILDALQHLASPLMLKSDLSRRRPENET